MTYNYRIAGVSVCFLPDCPLVENRDTLLFTAASSPDAVTFPLSSADSLEIPTGQTFSFADGEVILSGDTYTRVLRHRASNIPLVTVQRKIGSPGGTIRSLIAEMPYTIRTQVLWSAVDLPYTLLQYDTLTIHAAVIRFGSAAILFTAPSGTGKSTQAALWEKYRDAVVVNGDKGAISVHGGEIHAHGLPFCGTSGICSAYDLPVRAIVSLTQAPENTAVRLHGAAALQAVVQNSFGTKSHRPCLRDPRKGSGLPPVLHPRRTRRGCPLAGDIPLNRRRK